MRHRAFLSAFLVPILAARYAALATVFLALPTLAACPARAPVTDCTPNTTRCGPESLAPEVCSASRRWQPTAAESCATGTACCLVTSLEGGQIHACAPADGSSCVEPLPGGQYAPPSAPPESIQPSADGAEPGVRSGHGVSAEAIPWHAFVPRRGNGD